ncbi:MAG: glycine--tRNA ligase subunit beta [Rhizobiales bacterium]|nr:glycine--tRNA ligase subunit beta [Hyphomicrobiales bacterium]
MSELLLELFSEEIPSRMQKKAGEDLARLVTLGLKEAGLDFGEVRHFETPRRLCLTVDGIPKKSSDVREERKGPRIDAPEKALEGFLRSTGLTLEECEIHDDKKGQFYVAVIDREGRTAESIISEVVTNVVRNFPWPKSMRWGTSRLRWVRPLHSILCVFAGKPLKFIVDGVAADNKTQGHRFLGGREFAVKNFDEYASKLEKNKVILDPAKRAEIILKDAKALAKKKKLALVEDEGLLAEAAGLVEWPVVLMGTFDKAFLDVPSEVLIGTLKSHQKCFSVRKGKSLVNKFILVSNLETGDDGAEIIAGNERVIRARLSDAKFFWDNDLARPLDDLLPKLEEIVFHAKLGTVGERVKRLESLSGLIAKQIGADVTLTKEAAKYVKADLVSETVYEAPDMQGIAGRYLALAEGKDESVAAAIEEHYKPLGPTDAVPSEPVSMAVALAEKIDILTGFWAIDEKPTGSKDPFALRRAALGVIRIVLENGLRLPLKDLFKEARSEFFSEEKLVNDLLSFFADRLKVYLRDQGARHDLIDAVFSLGGQDDLLMIVKRVEALSTFLDTDDGVNLLAGIKRAENILRIEEKKDKTRYAAEVNEDLLKVAQEKALNKAIKSVSKKVTSLIKKEDFEGAMSELSKLRRPVDAFFDGVIVNDEAADVRKNRLALLAAIRGAALGIARFGKIEG